MDGGGTDIHAPEQVSLSAHIRSLSKYPHSHGDGRARQEVLTHSPMCFLSFPEKTPSPTGAEITACWRTLVTRTHPFFCCCNYAMCTSSLDTTFYQFDVHM